MATSIKGLTIKIGADTKELTAALRGVNKQLNTSRGDLLSIQKALKFNPGNTKLLEQQQRTYQTAVKSTEEKLEKLRQTQKEMEAAGVTEKQQAQYDALTREIIKTENQLQKLKTESILAGNGTGGFATTAHTMQSVSETMGKVSSTTGKWSSSLANVSSKLSGINRAILGVSTAAAAIFLRAGWNRMEKMDTARTKMKAIGMSAEDTASAMESANKAVLGTSYGLDAAANAAAQASAAGVKQGREMDQWLQAISDSAAVAGVDFEEMGDIFTKVATNGKATNRELQQLSKRGIPIYQYLADQLGVTTDEVFNMARRGEIDMASFRKSITTHINGAAKELGSSTITGAIELVKSAVARVGEAFIGSSDDASSFAGQIHDVLLDLRATIDNLKPAAKELGANFGKTFKVIYTYLKTGTYYGDSLNGSFKTIAGTFKVLIDTVKGVARVFSAMPEWAKKATILTGVLGAPLTKAASGAFGAISSLTGALSRGSEALAKWAANKAAKATVDGVGSAASRASGKIASAVGALSKMALPIAGIVAAVALLAPALAKLGTNKEIAKLTEEMRQLKSETDMMVESAKANTQAAKDSISAVTGEGMAVDALINRVINLDNTRDKSNAQIEEEKALINQLNKEIPDLNLAYDETTGKLNMTEDALKKTADAWKKEAKAEALAQAMTEEYKNIAQYEAQRPKLVEAQQKAYDKLVEAKRQYNDAEKAGAGPQRLQQLSGAVTDARNAYNDATGAVKDLDKSIGESYDQIDLWSGELSGAAGDAEQAIGSLGQKTTGTLVPLPSKIKGLGSAGGAAFASGVNLAATAAANAGKNVGNASMTGTKQGIDANASKPKSAAKSAVDKAKPSIPTKSGGWFNLGANMSQGMANGIKSLIPTLSSAAGGVVGAALTAARKKAQVNSPSKLFMHGVGEPIGEGIAVGIDNSTKLATKAAGRQITDIEAAYSGISLGLKSSVDTLTGAMNYAMSTPDTPTQDQATANAMMAGLAQIGAALVSAMPNDIVLNINGQQIATAVWGDLANEAQRQGKVLAVDSNIAKGLVGA